MSAGKLLATILVICLIGITIIGGGWFLLGMGAKYVWDNREEISETIGEETRNLQDNFEKGRSN